MDDSDKITQILNQNLPAKAEATDVADLKSKKASLGQILNTYISNLDADIAQTDSAVNAVLTARTAVDADGNVNANIKAELRALEAAILKFRTECRDYRTAFVWIRDNFCS